MDPFPTLKSSVIIQIMEELKIPLTAAELSEPGRFKERVREVFTRLLMVCLGITTSKSSFSTALPNRVNNILRNEFQNPELYAGAFPEVKFFCLLSKIMKICGNGDNFGFKDLHAPTSKRFKRQLSAIINFLKYKEDMQYLVEQVFEDREDLYAAVDEIAEQSAALEGELDRVQKLHKTKMLEHDLAIAECKEMVADIAQQNQKQALIRQETCSLRRSANELTDQIANLSISLRELQGEERQLSKEVVDSPDNIKYELATAKEKLEGIKKLIEANEQESKMVQLKIQHAMTAEGDTRRVVQSLNEMGTKIQEYEVVMEDLDDMTSRLEGAERKFQESTREKEVQEQKLQVAEKRKADTSKMLNKTLQQSQKEVQLAVEKLGVVEKDRSDGFARIEESQQRVVELENRMEEERKRTMYIVDSRIASFKKFEKKFFEQELNGLEKIL